MKSGIRSLAVVAVVAGVVAGGCSSRSFSNPSGPAGQTQFGAITGTVVLSSANQTFPALLPDVDVALTQPDGIQLHGLTTNQGVFTFGSLSPGTYTLQVNVNAAPGAPVLFAATTSVGSVVVAAGKTSNVGQIAPTYNVGTSSSAVAEVEVFGLVRSDLHVDAGQFVIDGGIDLTGTQVNVYFAGQESQPFTVTFTQANGSFGQLLPPGTYDFYATNPLFVPGSELGIVVGADGGADGGIESLLQPIVMAINPARLTGTVVLERDPNVSDGGPGDGGTFAPEAGVLVSTAFGGTGITDSSGVFLVNNLLGAPDQVSFVAPTSPVGETYHTSLATFPVTLQAGNLTNMTASQPVQMLLDRGTITGQVKMEDGTSSQGVTVGLVGTHLAAVVAPEADPSIGDFSFENVPVRFGYQISASAAHYLSQSVPVPVSFVGNGANVDVGTIALAPEQGDFAITSANPNSHVGFTNTLDVSIFVSGAPSGATQLRISENASFAAADGGSSPWVSLVTTAPGNVFTLSDVDGYHTVYAEYQDPTLNMPGPLLSAPVLLDRARPNNASVVVTSGKTFVNTNQNLSLSLIATDPSPNTSSPPAGLSGMVIASSYTGADFDGGLLAGSLVTYSPYIGFPANNAVLADGPAMVFAQFYDSAGNTSAIVSTYLVVDTVPPAGSLTITSLSNSDPGYTNSPLVLVNELFNLPDGGVRNAPAEPFGGTDLVQLSNDANTVHNAAYLPASGQQTWALEPVPDGGSAAPDGGVTTQGQTYVYLVLTDSAGNQSPVYSTGVKLFTQAPSGTVQLIAPSVAGPRSVNPASTNATTVELDYNLNGLAVDDPVSIEVSEQPTSCASIPTSAYTRANGTQATVSYAFAPNTVGGTVQDGNKTLFTCLRDAAGNTSQLDVQVVLNRQAPNSQVTVGNGAAVQDDGTSSLTTVTLSNFSSDVTGIEVSTSPLSCDGGTFTPFNPSNPFVQVQTPTNGVYTVYVCVEDAAGNIKGLTPITFTEDTSTPVGTMAIQGTKDDGTTLSTSYTHSTVVTLLLSANAGPGDAVISMQVANDDKNNLGTAVALPYSTNPSWNLSPGAGPKTVWVQFIDEAGVVSAPISAQIILDTTAPSVALNVVANGVTNPQTTNANQLQLQYVIGSGTTPIQVSVSETGTCLTSAAVYGPLPSGTPPTQTIQLLDGLFPDGGGPDAGVDDQITIYACFQDPAGNTTQVTASLLHDTIPPQGFMTIAGQPTQGSQAVAITVQSISAVQMAVVAQAPGADAPNCATATNYQPYAPSAGINLPNGTYALYVCLEDAAGNTALATSTTFSNQLTINTALPSGPTVTLTGITPAVVTDGDAVSISFSANQPISACSATVGGASTTCTLGGQVTAPTCLCTLVVSPTLLQGALSVSATVQGPTGTGLADGILQVDRTSPVVTAADWTIVRQPVGTNDALVASAGGALDSVAPTYAAQTVTEVRIWSSAVGGTPLLIAVPASDGSLAQLNLPATTTLAPPQIWVSAIDLPGNESARIAVTAGADTTGPVANVSSVALVRNPVGQVDELAFQAGAFTTVCALTQIQAFAQATGGSAFASTPASGSAVQIPIGDGGSSLPEVWVAGNDKCGLQGPLLAVATGLDAAPPVVAGGALTWLRNQQNTNDGLWGDAGAVSGTAAIVQVRVYDSADAGATLLATFAPNSNGAFPTKTLTDATIGVRPERVWVEATDKAGLISTRVSALNVQANLGLQGRAQYDSSRSPVAMYPLVTDISPLTASPGLAPFLFEEASTLAEGQAAKADLATASTASAPQAAYGPAWATTVPQTGWGSLAYSAQDGSLELLSVPFVCGDFQGLAPPALWNWSSDTWKQEPPVIEGVTTWSGTAFPISFRFMATTPDPITGGVIAMSQGFILPSGTSNTTLELSDHAVQFLDPDAGLPMFSTSPFTMPNFFNLTTDSDRGVAIFAEHQPTLDGTNVVKDGGALETWELTDAGWSQIPTAHIPLLANDILLAYDSARHRTVLLGSNESGGAQTWEYTPNGSSHDWTEVTTAHAPPVRAWSSMAFDPQLPGVVLFGGFNTTTDALLSDTWLYNGTDWQQLSPANSPTARYASTLAYDPTTQLLTLYGGIDSPDLYNLGTTCPVSSAETDVWTFNGTSWTSQTPANPPARYLAASTYSTRDGAMLLFGGINDTLGEQFNDVWAFNGQAWTNPNPGGTQSTVPSARTSAGLAYDSRRGRTLLFGGSSSSGPLGDLWSYAGGVWTQLSTVGGPAARYSAGLAYDAVRDRLVLFGGSNGGFFFGDTWEFDGANWQQVTLPDGPSPRLGAGMVYDPVRGAIDLYGGTAFDGTNFPDLWTYGGPVTGWQSQTILTPACVQTEGAQGVCFAPPASFTLAFDPSDLVAVDGGPVTTSGLGLFGGTASVSQFGTTSAVLYGQYEFTAGNWVLPINEELFGGGVNGYYSVTVPARTHDALTYLPPPVDSMLLFGGLLPTGGSGNNVNTVRTVLGTTALYRARLAEPTYAAQTFSFDLGEGVAASQLTVLYTGQGLGTAGSAAQVLIWNGATGAWVALGTDTTGASVSYPVTPDPIAGFAPYLQEGQRVWVMALNPTPTLPTAGSNNSVQTDDIELDVNYVLP